MRPLPRTTRERSPWAIISILAAVLLFGMFWLWQYPAHAPVQEVPVLPVSQRPAPKPVSLSDLEANAVNIVIPSFEEVL